MNSALLGLVGGLVGGMIANLLLVSPAEELASLPLSTIASGKGEVEIGDSGPRLHASGTRKTTGSQGGLSLELAVAVDERVSAALRSNLDALIREAESAQRVPVQPSRRVPLRDAAYKLSLSQEEEENVRAVYAHAETKLYRLMASETESSEDIRLRVERSRGDPERLAPLLAGYVPHLLPHLGEIMALHTELRQGVSAAIGPKRAHELQEVGVLEDFILELGGGVTIEVEPAPNLGNTRPSSSSIHK